MKFLPVVLAVLTTSLTAAAGELVYPKTAIKIAQKNQSLLASAAGELGLTLGPADFRLLEVKESLLGTHTLYQQTLAGVDIEGAQLVVSVSPEGEIAKIYNSTVHPALKTKSVASVTPSQAQEIAWKSLAVTGSLSALAQTKLVFDENLRLVYKVTVNMSEPSVSTVVTVDARSGAILESKDAALPRQKRAVQNPAAKTKAKFSSYAAAAKAYQASLGVSEKSISKAVNGTAQIFDPNPVVTLVRADLEDTSPLNLFTQAYRTEDLLDITSEGGVYKLKGPNVTLADFEAPRMEPSTSPDGAWVYERKNPKFNEAMTYFHLDRSIRYLQSLGYKNAKAIFKKSIEVDSNALNGDDNSHFVPSTNRLGFGSGCVDDNEDADVILHELGHAIHFNINSSWAGGDTGAIGEGFGDYWAATSSLFAQNGRDGNINWVFKWDGHNKCWPGRKLNAFTPVYDPSRFYDAHAQVNGGISDEVWSTPIFQAFLELDARGVARSDIDKIVLEAHFGLGSGVKMPVLATSIVKTAKTMFPAKDYDQVFLRHFKKMQILK